MKVQNRPGRPMGEISQALLSAAKPGPATMATLARRAQVGYQAARFKVPALARAGALVALTDERPRLYALPEIEACTETADAFVMLTQLFWEAADGA